MTTALKQSSRSPRPPRSPETDLTLKRVRDGLESERQAALEQLQQQAREQGSLDAWNRVGIGLHLAGLNTEAIRIFEGLVREAPGQDEYRLNLATGYSTTEQIALSRYHLLHLAEHAANPEMRRLGREQLDGYDHFLGNTPAERKRRDSEVRKLRDAITRPEKKADDFIALARLLIRRSQLDADTKWRDEATNILEQGFASFPQAVEIIELLVGSYLHHDPDKRLGVMVNLLRQVAPASRVLRILANRDADEVRKFPANMLNRVNGLVQRFVGGDAALRKAALHDLAGIVATFPDSPQYRLPYAFALMAMGQQSAALEQATMLSQHSVDTQTFHFNLGQVFWGCGDAERGRQHLDLALQFAATDQERQEVLDRVRDLESRAS